MTLASPPPQGSPANGRSKFCATCGARYPADYAVCPRDATPLTGEGAFADPMLGQILGDTYEVTRLLGEGGMGRVYESRQVRLGRRFAIKILHAHFCADSESVARFRREATAAAAIVSPYVAEVLDVNVTRQGQPYIVSELLEGEDLRTVLKRDTTISMGRAVSIARQVAQGLHAAHVAGVVHRDLKPENIMLVPGPDGRDLAKVLDFGVAKSLADNSSLTRTGAVLGTPAYMAPEQARGGSEVDHRCDIYALGAVLYRVLTGRPAFAEEDVSRTLTSVLYDEPERPKTLRRDLPDGLELIIQQAMAKRPDARYPSMMELDAALRPFDNGEQLTTRRDSEVAPREPREIGRADTVIATVSAITATITADEVRARRARPRALAYGILALSWCLLLLVSLLAKLIAGITQRPPAPVERYLAVALAVALTMPLVFLWVRDLTRGTWRNTAAMLGRADRLARAAAASFGAYGMLSAAEGVYALLCHGSVRAAGDWLPLAAALLAGGLTVWRDRRRA